MIFHIRKKHFFKRSALKYGWIKKSIYSGNTGVFFSFDNQAVGKIK
ncbi:hypothetical protein [Escherichia coli ISC7]|uniref:Uncharacterized protein n=1 Tax=Escherichia coli ISC7 TaxID=1432555 RepID=W1F931_ECOLX|nr:hypothetical protein [Escherichia coli ISC7]